MILHSLHKVSLQKGKPRSLLAVPGYLGRMVEGGGMLGLVVWGGFLSGSDGEGVLKKESKVVCLRVPGGFEVIGV